jgi:hypothetical protein
MSIPDGTPPDLIFYYSVDNTINQIDESYLGTSLIQTFNGPIFADFNLTQEIGKWAGSYTIYDVNKNDKVYQQTGIQTYYLPEGTITIINNTQQIKNQQGEFVNKPGENVYQITSGSGNFLNYSGFLVNIAVKDTLTRTLLVYFSKTNAFSN